MSDRIRWWGMPLVTAGAVLAVVAVLVVFSGCKKAETPAAQKTSPMPMHEQAAPAAGHDMGQMPMHEQTALTSAATPATKEQTLCPVMGIPINKEIFVEYQGKKVYFCCKDCVEVFKADPQKYLAKLPQFQP
jgi:YHS domain-containing protein